VKYTVTTGPTGRPVDWATFKAHARLDSDDEQTIGETYLDAAADYAADALGGSLMAQTITAVYYAEDVPHPSPFHVVTCRPTLPLPRGPVTAVTSVTDADGTAVTAYDLVRIGHSDRLRINVGWKAPLTVVYTAGYANAAAVPAAIRAAILMHAATLYENRESVSDRTKTPVPHSLADFYRLKSRNTGAA
jgi:uncharacterized phiE125 gp8 family phage protein